ncbi:MAG TPA: SDR family NAD(P)-dependent oxidoreductase [Stellaceae bacterium]|nr:SDR family NAD(P)-dependent oxidoreductase [Stellaceae bacterium]
MTEPLPRPRRKDPLRKTREPLSPQGARSRTALGLTAAAAEGRFALQVCGECGAAVYPPRDACPKCLSPRLPFMPVPNGGVLLAATTIRTSTDVYFRERMPWRIGTVELDAGPVILAHLHGDTREGERVRLEWKLDKSGEAVAFALPATETPNMADDPQWRELTCDPKFRRVLVTDGRHAVGQAVAAALAQAEAATVFVGIADPWKPFPGEAALRNTARVEIVPLDPTDTLSVEELAGEIGARVDILVNTAEHVRPGGIIERKGLTVAREEIEIRYFGLLRLAQSFGAAMRARGADGVNSAAAFVNLFSVFALVNWPLYGAFSATEAAALSAAQSLRAELRAGGVRVMNVFAGPIESDWYQSVPPPKVTPAALAAAVVDGLRRGLEEVFVGDIAQDIRARLAVNPKAVERELG